MDELLALDGSQGWPPEWRRQLAYIHAFPEAVDMPDHLIRSHSMAQARELWVGERYLAAVCDGVPTHALRREYVKALRVAVACGEAIREREF